MEVKQNQAAAAVDLSAVVNATIRQQREVSKAKAELAAIPPKERLIRLPEVMSRCGIGKSLIYGLLAQQQFPACVRIGGRSVAWRESSIDAWIQARIDLQAESEYVK